jgi:hypothetical protein
MQRRNRMMINCTAQCTCGDRTLTGKHPEHARQSGLDMIFIFPGPGQQFVDAIDGVAIHHPREHVAQVSVRFDIVQLAGFDQRADDCPSIAATVAAGKEMILAAERHGRDSTLNWIGVELDAAIVEEAGQALPARERVTDRLGQRATSSNRISDVAAAALSAREPAGEIEFLVSGECEAFVRRCR